MLHPFSVPLCKIQPVLDPHRFASSWINIFTNHKPKKGSRSRTTWFATSRPPFERPIRATRPAGNHAQLRHQQQIHPPRKEKWYPGIPSSQTAWHCLIHWCSSLLVRIEQSQCRQTATSSRDGKTTWPLCFWCSKTTRRRMARERRRACYSCVILKKM